MHLERNYLPAYVHLAALCSMVKKRDDPSNDCRLGLYAVDRLRSAPLHQSELATVKNAGRDFDTIEGQLKAIQAGLR